MSVTVRRLRRGRRLAPEARRDSLLDVATGLVLAHGILPLSVEELADAAKVSKALIYRYFPEPHDLYNALVGRALADLATPEIEQAVRAADPVDAACEAADTYYRHVATGGPLIQVILRDQYMAGRVSSEARTIRDRLTSPLTKTIRRAFRLSPREARACVSLGLTMPEECGRLAFQGHLELDAGAVLCRELVLGVLDVARRRGLEARG